VLGRAARRTPAPGAMPFGFADMSHNRRPRFRNSPTNRFKRGFLGSGVLPRSRFLNSAAARRALEKAPGRRSKSNRIQSPSASRPNHTRSPASRLSPPFPVPQTSPRFYTAPTSQAPRNPPNGVDEFSPSQPPSRTQSAERIDESNRANPCQARSGPEPIRSPRVSPAPNHATRQIANPRPKEPTCQTKPIENCRATPATVTKHATSRQGGRRISPQP